MLFSWGPRRDPFWAEFERLQRGVDDLFAALGGARRSVPGTIWRPASLFPLLNVRREGDVFTVTAEIPGMKIEDLDIKVEGDTLSLKGRRKHDEPGESFSYHRRERASGTFQRSLTLPTRVDAERVTATYKNGVLTITLPVEQAARAKQIAITQE